MSAADQCRRSETRVLKFTDTVADVNGVCRFIQGTAETALATGRALTVFCSTRLVVPACSGIRNFTPVFACPMPGYDTLDFAVPPILTMLRAGEEFGADVIHISTPGPVGLVGMALAKLTRTPVVGIYHTDFPAYIDELFGSSCMSWCARFGMRAFYKRFETVLTRSADYADRLERLGLEPTRIRLLRAGFDSTKFSPAYRDTGIWGGLGVPAEGVKVLFCGRVSTEKNLPVLTRYWGSIRDRVERAGGAVQLIVIGDGPYRETMERQLGGRGAYFLGFRHGEELAALYASSNLFAFPSTTDTLGQVVMEAQASGLAVLATDQGGPGEVIEDGVTGVVSSIDEPGRWVDVLVDLVLDSDRRESMGRAGVEYMKGFGFGASFEDYWSVHECARRDR